MSMRPAVVLSVWTMLVWTTRIGNIWNDDDLSLVGQLGRTALAVTFTVFAVAAVAAAVQARKSVVPWARRVAWAFGVFTIGYWAIRVVQIAMADHSVGFIAVHTVLGAVSIGLAGWMLTTRAPVTESEVRPGRG